MSSHASPWDALSARFDAHTKDLHPSAADNIVIAWPSLLTMMGQYGEGQIRTVLDFGCGTGGFCAELAKREYTVTGIDSSELMIIAARQHSLPTIRYEVGDAQTLLTLGQSFDCVTSIMVLQFIEDVGTVATAFAQILRPEGLAIFATINPAFVERCVAQGVRYKDMQRKKGTITARMEFNPEAQFTIFARSAEEYKACFTQRGFSFLTSVTPSFPNGFAKKYQWKLPTDVPEFLIMAFKKI